MRIRARICGRRGRAAHGGWGGEKKFHNNNNNKIANKRKTRQKEKQHSRRATARHFYSPGETSSISLKQLYIERNASSKSRFMLMPWCCEMERHRHVFVLFFSILSTEKKPPAVPDLNFSGVLFMQWLIIPSSLDHF